MMVCLHGMMLNIILARSPLQLGMVGVLGFTLLIAFINMIISAVLVASYVSFAITWSSSWEPPSTDVRLMGKERRIWSES
jgi:hypothetical protein